LVRVALRRPGGVAILNRVRCLGDSADGEMLGANICWKVSLEGMLQFGARGGLMRKDAEFGSKRSRQEAFLMRFRARDGERFDGSGTTG